MKKSFIFIALSLTVSICKSQDPAIKREEWTEKPSLHVLNGSLEKESAVVIRDLRRVEYVDVPNNLTEYYTYHRIVHINDNIGIESFNKIYLATNDKNEIVDIRARTILPGGKIIDIDKSNIKDLKDNDGSQYKIFAMEGLEKGCEIEYSYTFKREPSWFGKEIFQGKFPILEGQMEILAPKRLGFQLRGYNCAATILDTTINDKRIFSAALNTIPGAETEKYAASKANLERIEFKLSYNTSVSGGRERLFTWNELAKRIHTIYDSYTEKELSRTKDMISSNGWDKLTGTPAKVIAIENYLKKQFTTRDDIDAENAGNLEWIIKNKIASHMGMIRLYGALFEKLGVEHELVLTCSRSIAEIDKTFENWNNASDFLFYFPETKKFLAPTLLYTRYPWIDPYWGAHDALYCKTTTIGTFTTALAEIKPLPLEDYTQSFNRIESSLRFNPGLDTLLIDMKQSYGGYSAAPYRAGMTLSNPDEQRAFLKEMVKFGTNSENIVSSKIDNGDYESYSENKPFTLNCSVKASELLENAGNKILVKIGEIIGPQGEMYQEKARQFPLQLAFPHTLERFITFQVPDGYTVRNANELNIHNDFLEDGQVTMGFTSDYKMEGKLITIHVLEQYRRTAYPLSDYENFRKVINSSADFNKIVLVLEH